MPYKATKTFGDDIVTITCSCNEVDFTINGSMSMSTSSNKVAITRWLLSELEEIKTDYKYLLISPYWGDGNEEYRKRIFTKLGFQPKGKYYVWNPKGRRIPELD